MWIDDQIVKNCDQKIVVEVFVPPSTMVVLGSGNDASLEVREEQCAVRGIPVLRRYGGGGTVVLYSGCVVVSVGCWAEDPFQNSFYFKLLNQAVINSLAKSWPSMSSLSQAGISDIVFGPKKIAGTSLFRSRNYLLYQASMIVFSDFELIESVLKHPTREPSYRQGRGHHDFLTSLNQVDPTISQVDAVVDTLKTFFLPEMLNLFTGRLVEPVAAHIPALMARVERSLTLQP